MRLQSFSKPFSYIANLFVCDNEYHVNYNTRKYFEKRVLRKAGTAIHDFRMIEHGDRVMAAVSGGKDSIVLLKVLIELKRVAPVHFEIIPVHVSTGFEKDFGRVRDWIHDHLGLTVHVFDSGINEILAHSSDPEKSPCALCSRLRRGILYSMAQKENYTSIALGHHMDDIIETFLLRCFYTGQVGGMAPSRVSDDGKNRIIRPLAYCKSELVESYFRTFEVEPVVNSCPKRLDGKREQVRGYLSLLEKDIPTVKESILSALGNIDMKSLCLKETPGAHSH